MEPIREGLPEIFELSSDTSEVTRVNLRSDFAFGIVNADTVNADTVNATDGNVSGVLTVNDLIIESAGSTLLSYQKDEVIRMFSTTYADGWSPEAFTAPAKSMVKVDFALPARNDSVTWGGGYTEVQVKLDDGAWVSYGNSGYDTAVMENNGSSISTYSNHFVIDLSAQTKDTLVYLKFRHRSYDGTLQINASHDITPSGSYAWSHIIAYTLTGLTGTQGIQGDAATIAVGTVTAGEDPEDAAVVNSGTSGDAIFDFTLPKGDPGTTVPDISGLTECTDPDPTADSLIMYDASTASHKRMDLDKWYPPIGFIYIQFPGKASPEALWPEVGGVLWEVRSGTGAAFDGVFFRAEGTNADLFETVAQQGHMFQDHAHSHNHYFRYNSGGGLGPAANTTSSNGYGYVSTDASGASSGTRGAETRPVNRTIKIWERTA